MKLIKSPKCNICSGSMDRSYPHDLDEGNAEHARFLTIICLPCFAECFERHLTSPAQNAEQAFVLNLAHRAASALRKRRRKKAPKMIVEDRALPSIQRLCYMNYLLSIDAYRGAPFTNLTSSSYYYWYRDVEFHGSIHVYKTVALLRRQRRALGVRGMACYQAERIKRLWESYHHYKEEVENVAEDEMMALTSVLAGRNNGRRISKFQTHYLDGLARADVFVMLPLLSHWYSVLRNKYGCTEARRVCNQ